MVLEADVDKQLTTTFENRSKTRSALDLLTKDVETAALMTQANLVSIKRMGFNDHGRVHAKIVSLNAARIFALLLEQGVSPNITREEIGDEDDALFAIVLGSYLHDIGISISRDSHDILGVHLGRPIIARILPKLIQDPEKSARITPIVLEEILCHLGHYKTTSLEAKIVATADGTDMTKGRARIPYQISKPDIHQFSAMSVERVEISKGQRKPIRIGVEMNDSAGIFQIEHQLLQKIVDVGFSDYVEIHARIKDGREATYLT